jgi:hypothetical protein
MSDRELWVVIHGIVLGALFLIAFAAGLVGLFSLKERPLTGQGVEERTPRLLSGAWIMAIVAWLIVITGTWIVYPWYRAPAPEGADLTQYPRNFLIADPNLAWLHQFGMEWKEHVAWMAPMLATTVAFVILYYGNQLARRREMRWPLIVVFILAFASVGIAGLFGVLINDAAPII